MSENYREPEDLLSDPEFLSWYINTSKTDPPTWEKWTQGQSDRDLLVKKAVALLDATRIPEKEPSPQQIDQAEARLFATLESLDADARHTQIQPVSVELPAKRTAVIGRRRWMIAASILVLLAAGFLLSRYIPGHRSGIATDFGQITSQQLPDGSMVMINANSRLSYSNGWQEGKDREVWIDGEAFFHVTKTPNKSKFIVHTEHFDIIVTGTQFNVSNRHG